MNDDYSDIIDLPHPTSKKHPRMSMLNRAAQFAPFAALTGFGQAIDETARLTDRRIELGEAELAELNDKLSRLMERLPAEAEAGKPAKQEKGGKKQQGLMQKVLKATLTAVTATLGTIVGSAASDAISGKKTKKKTSAGQRIVKNSTSAATRTITRELTRDILGNLIK